MTSVVLTLWLAAGSAAAAPETSLTPPPLTPTVEAPSAPSPAAPPVPAPPLPHVPPRPSLPGAAPARGAGASPGRTLAPEAAGGAEAAAGEASAQRREATPDKPAASARPASGKSARPAASGKRPPQPVLPTLSTTALKNELRQSLATPAEAGAPVSERARLEQLASEIAHAREALRQETARLEALIKQSEGDGRSPSGESNPAADAAAAAAKDMAREQLDSAAKKGATP